ncbi:MAG: hypothetical protein M1835_004995 [Candelina submexicana]|nr:MAG: hypothetical protein M1835_004995 [Candelina submexicana]
MDEAVAQFTSITGASPQRAVQYLRLTDSNLEQAVQLFFDSDGVDLEGQDPPSEPTMSQPVRTPTEPPARTQRVGSAGFEDRSGVVHLDSDEDISDDNDPQVTGYPPRAAQKAGRTGGTSQAPTGVPLSARGAGRSTEDDEAMARRMQEEMYAGGDMSGVLDADGVRAPMARTTETLVGPGANYGEGPEDMRAAIAEQMLVRQRRNLGRPGIFNQRATPASVWDNDSVDPASRRQNLAQATAGASEASAKSNLLAEMYRPPFEIMTRLPWDEARQEGRDKEKWILVNVQDPAVFDCQVLNRDIWKNPGVKETVKENFVFIQYGKDDPNGNQYNQYYFQDRDNQDAYPHIAIVDPRTGEQVKKWSGPPVPKAMDFLMQLHEFLDRYSLHVNARNPVANRKPEKKSVDMNTMTEEEMLQMAMQNSLNNDGGAKEVDPDELTRDTEEAGKGKHKADDATDDSSNDVKPQVAGGQRGPDVGVASPFSLISSTNPHVEPPHDPATTTRIQFRHSGGRIIRRFALTDPVRRLYEWLKAAPLDGKEGVEFELISMGRNLMDHMADTIEYAGLKNGTVMVEHIV